MHYDTAFRHIECDAQGHYRNCRSWSIAAGSSQMQRCLIAGLMGIKPQ